MADQHPGGMVKIREFGNRQNAPPDLPTAGTELGLSQAGDGIPSLTFQVPHSTFHVPRCALIVESVAEVEGINNGAPNVSEGRI